MQTKHLCVLIHTRTKGEVGTVKLVEALKRTIFTDHSKAVLFQLTIFVIYVSSLSCFLVCSLQPCGHLLGKGWSLGSLVYYVLLCFCHFPMWCSGSGVVLDCIDS